MAMTDEQLKEQLQKTRWKDGNLNEGRRTALTSNAYMRTALPRELRLQQQYGDAFSQQGVDDTTYRRMAESEAVDENWGEFRETMMRNSPEFARSTAKFDEQIGTIGSSEIEDELQQQALSELKLGATLTPEEQMEVSQASRAGWSARGLVNSTPSAANEVLDRLNYANARRDQRRGFAQGVDAQVNQRQSSDRQFAQAAMGTTAALLDPFSRMFPGGSQEGMLDYSKALSTANVGNSALDRQMQYRLTREGFGHSSSLAEMGYEHDASQARLNAGYADKIGARNAAAAKDAADAQRTASYVSAGVSILGALLAF